MNYSDIINQVKQRYFELYAKSQQAKASALMLEEKLQSKSDELEQLKNTNKSLNEQLEFYKNELQTAQSTFQAELDNLKIQLENNNDNTKQIDVSGIVREIDDCIILVKNSL